MKQLLPVAALVALLGLAGAGIHAGSQQTVSIGPGFFTGKDYLDMTDNERRAYATGAINGMLVAPFFGAPPDNLNWLKSRCDYHEVHQQPGKPVELQPQRPHLQRPAKRLSENEVVSKSASVVRYPILQSISLFPPEYAKKSRT